MMQVTLGKRLDLGEPLRFTLKGGHHMLIAGLTGFGKSNEINYMLYQASRFSQVQFVICNAAGKPDYVQWLPRASAVAVGKLATDAAIDGALDIMHERYATLLPEGISSHMTDAMARAYALTTSRQVVISDDMPLIVIIIDEFVQYLAGRGTKDRNTAKLHELITIGRAAGMLVILATQRPSVNVASTDLRENVPFKVSFALDRNGAHMVFGDQADEVPLEELDIPGHGYAIVDGQRANIPFIAPECPERAAGLRAIETEDLRMDFKEIDRYSDDNLV